MKTFLFNPYTGTPRHPSDISSDPEGLLIAEPGAHPMAASKEATTEHAALMKFYGVGSLYELVVIQAYHIEKLQAKLPKTPNVFAPQRVREG